MLRKLFERSIPASFPDVSGLLEQQYRQQVTQNHIQHDGAQVFALQQLQTLLEQLLAALIHEQTSITYKFLLPSPQKCRSLYLFGEVGRGKSMLMALFYQACPFEQKRRVHFNVFMLEVHAYMHDYRLQQQSGDAMSALAATIRASLLLLCLDEFHVTDIADAMILERLFSKLWASGVIVVITSNRHPDDLYLGGLQREQFLVFSKRLQQESQIIELVAKEDYRLNHLHALETTYYFPLDAKADAFVQQSYNEFTNFADRHPGVLQVFGRQVVLSAVHGDIVLTSFDELCAQALGSADYLELAREFSTVIMADIPQLTADKRNEAKRFMTLIDALYEHKVKLICTAEVSPSALYTEGDGAFEFKRTASRLMEMQSDAYFRSKHL